jgi:hypothetical protein
MSALGMNALQVGGWESGTRVPNRSRRTEPLEAQCRFVTASDRQIRFAPHNQRGDFGQGSSAIQRSARANHGVLEVAPTIARLEYCCDQIEVNRFVDVLQN